MFCLVYRIVFLFVLPFGVINDNNSNVLATDNKQNSRKRRPAIKADPMPVFTNCLIMEGNAIASVRLAILCFHPNFRGQ